MLPFGAFVDLLPYLAQARYRMPGQCPTAPAGVGLSSSYIGTEYTNCTMATAWLVSQAFGTAFSGDQWSRWQVWDQDSKGYGPGVTHEWEVGYQAREKMKPLGGMWLIQYFRPVFPSGHSMLVLDYHRSGKILTLEANTAGAGLDGLGWGGIGPVRDIPNPGEDWHEKTDQTWEGRCSGEVSMSRLYVEASSIETWLRSG